MGNAQNRKSRPKTRPGPRRFGLGPTGRPRGRPRLTPIVQERTENEDTVITQGFQCTKCPHHPIFFESELEAHRDLHKMQKYLRESSFQDVVRIPLDHPMVAVSNPRFMRRRTSRTGIDYFILTNPLVLSRKVEEDRLVQEQYNAALDRLNQALGNNNTLPLMPENSMSEDDTTDEIEQKPEVIVKEETPKIKRRKGFWGPASKRNKGNGGDEGGAEGGGT